MSLILTAPAAATTKKHRGWIVRPLRRWLYRDLEKANDSYLKTLRAAVAKARSILDVGCGYTAPVLESLVAPYACKVGLESVADLRQLEAPSVRFLRGTAEKLPFRDESFDLIICRSVLEHLSEPLRVFHEIARVLRPSGRFVFLTPNWFDYVSLGATLIPNSLHAVLVRFLTGRREEDTFPTRYRANTRYALRRMANTAGLGVESLLLLREHPHYLQFSSICYLLGVLYEQTAQRVVPTLRPWILGVFCKAQSA